jgi:esterase/lipase superfamily enzyme
LLLLVALMAVGVGGWSFYHWNGVLRRYLSHHQGVQYGPRRSGVDEVYYGYCDVSIPPSHQVGEVETPLLGPEDESRHVVVQRTARVAEAQYFAAVRQRLAEIGADRKSCFVFVHGYNVNFEMAAQRTAQMYFDLQFAGVPMFYSWPSRASLRHYFTDRNEINYSRDHLRRFLLSVVKQSSAERIHVIAHSMGADAVCQAISSLGEDQSRFDQIVLAAPDIDADVFEQQILPRLKGKSRRTTLYCSRNDWALRMSYQFNASPRVGDSSRDPFVADGLDTVDATDIDTELLGHTYYGDCIKLLQDMGQLLARDARPAERQLEPFYVIGGLPYWRFPEPRAAQPPAGVAPTRPAPPR